MMCETVLVNRPVNVVVMENPERNCCSLQFLTPTLYSTPEHKTLKSSEPARTAAVLSEIERLEWCTVFFKKKRKIKNWILGSKYMVFRMMPVPNLYEGYFKTLHRSRKPLRKGSVNELERCAASICYTKGNSGRRAPAKASWHFSESVSEQPH